tara:strand:- start:5409 stop:8468 length:3060 start_codon:yes stop_codon:yes gene_type:complete
MAVEQVGLEKLPNVYVKEIVLTDKFSPSTDASGAINSAISVVVSDYEQLNGTLAWFDYELFSKYIRVVVVQSTSTDFTQNITNGDVPLNPAVFVKLSSYDPQEVIYQTSKLKTVDKPKEFEIVVGDTKLFNFENQFNFEAPAGTQDLSYFAAVYIDLHDISNELNLDFSNPNIQSYHGAVASESALVSGQVQQTSILFRRSSGDIYAGPVHFQSGVGYMVGSQHSAEQHDQLLVETINNLKVKDKREKINDSKEISDTQTVNPYFSELYTSFDVTGIPSSLFTLNIRSLFLNKTEYGATLLQLDETLFDSILKKFKIEFFGIDRHQIQSGFLSNSLMTPDYYASAIYNRENILKTADQEEFMLRPNIRIETRSTKLDVFLSDYDSAKYVDFNEISKIQEVFVDENYSLRHFEFDDMVLTKNSNGVYRYKVNLLLRDPTLGYVVELRDELRAAYVKLESYYVRASVLKYKRSDIEGMTSEFIEEEYKNYADNLTAAPWINCVETYVKFLSFIETVSEADKDNLKKSLFVQLDPRTTTDSYINSFLFKYLEFMTRFDNFFILSGDRLYDSAKLIESTNNFTKDVIEVSHTFSNHIQPNLNGSQVDFIGQESPQTGLLKIDKSYYSELGNTQMNKMTMEAGSLTDAGFSDLSDELKLAFNDISSHALSYLSPYAIINQQNSLQVNTDSVITMAGIKEYVRETKRNSNKATDLIKRIQPDTRLLNSVNFSILTPKLVIPVQESEEEQTIKSREYLTDVSYFVRYDENIELCVSDAEDPTQIIEPDIQEALSNPVCRSLTQYSFMEDENRLAAALRSGNIEGNIEMLRAIPIHIKVLFASDSSKARNNYAESGMNYLCMPETRYYVEVNHFTINQIEYLSGYGTNSDGEINVKVPIWLLLTNNVLTSTAAPLFCRSNRYENPALGLSQTCTLDIPTAHKYFIISDTDTTIKPDKDITIGGDPLASAAGNALNESILYSTSNVVSQPDNKDSLLKGSISATATTTSVSTTAPVFTIAGNTPIGGY